MGLPPEKPKGLLRTILRDLGVLLHVPAVMALVTLPVALFFDELDAIAWLAVTGVVSLALGQALFFAFRNAPEMDVRHAMITAALAWLVIPMIGAIPFLGMALAADGTAASATFGEFRDPVNALFESMSGFTSTGLSMALAPSDLPHTLQWWRSFSQWIGGVGVVVLILTVFHPRRDTERLFFSEGRERDVFSDVVQAVRNIWWIYISFTAMGIVLLWLLGVGWWNAINLSMTGIATGGFTPFDDSLSSASPAVQGAMALLMILGAISFAAHYCLLMQRRVGVWWDQQTRALFVLLVGGGVLLLLENIWFLGHANVLETLFHWTSALCTGGFQTTDLNAWSPTAQLLLTFAMIIGGAAGSTAGGLKLWRMLLVMRSAAFRIERMTLQPWRIMIHREIAEGAERDLASPNVEMATILAVLWLFIVLAGALVLIHVGDFPLTAVLLEAASALGNVGLSTGIDHPDLPAAGKFALMILMWAGRLEIIPLFVLVASAIGALRRLRSE